MAPNTNRVSLLLLLITLTVPSYAILHPTSTTLAIVQATRTLCVINGTRDVHCWGPHANSIKSTFSGMYMNTLAAAGGTMCGLNKTGHIICSKNQPNVPSGETFEFTSLAVGLNKTCAIKRKNGAVVCWGRHGSYLPMGSTRFEFLVSGGNLTCGVTSGAFNVLCWDANERNSSAVIQSLPKVLPGVCVSDEGSCSCGIYPDSWNLCGGSGVICQKSDTNKEEESCQQFSSQVIQHPLAPSQSNGERPMQKTGTYIFIGIFVGIFGLILVCCCLIVLVWCTTRGGNQNEANLAVLVLQDMENVETFTFDVLSGATNSFDTVLGEGSYSTVYFGQLPGPGQPRVAVKRFKTNEGGIINIDEMFRNEVEAAYIGRHANVVRLIGYCTENHERIIVFEQMYRKTLSNHLHPTLYERNSPIYRSWTTRVKILLDVAQGLRHLHQNAVPRIIHRDIKPSNILIDANWVAKISDFGLALTGPEPGSEYVTSNQVALGTPAYADPVYTSNPTQVYPRFDVYSFGVVILEVLTGRIAASMAYDTLFVNTIVPLIEVGRFHEVQDIRLDVPVGDQVVAIERVVEIAQQCLRVDDRANMNDVVTALENALALCGPAAA